LHPQAGHDPIVLGDLILNLDPEVREGHAIKLDHLREPLGTAPRGHGHVVELVIDKVGGDEIADRREIALVEDLLDEATTTSLVFFSVHG